MCVCVCARTSKIHCIHFYLVGFLGSQLLPALLCLSLVSLVVGITSGCFFFGGEGRVVVVIAEKERERESRRVLDAPPYLVVPEITWFEI